MAVLVTAGDTDSAVIQFGEEVGIPLHVVFEIGLLEDRVTDVSGRGGCRLVVVRGSSREHAVHVGVSRASHRRVLADKRIEQTASRRRAWADKGLKKAPLK